MKEFRDIADLDEDARIKMIGKEVMRRPKEVIGVIVDDTPGTADRYVRKLITLFPRIRETGRVRGPLPNMITLSVGVKNEPESS